MFKAL